MRILGTLICLLWSAASALCGPLGGVSPPDPYIFATNTNSPGSNAYVIGKTPQAAIPITWAVIIIQGQSLWASNALGTYSTVSANARMFNVNDGANYPCANPVLGGSLVTNLGSNGPSCIIADGIIASGAYPGAVIVNIAQDGSSVADWNNPATLGNLTTVTWKRLVAAGLTSNPMLIMWHQGEQEAGLGTTGPAYTTGVQAVAQQWRTLGATAPFVLALETISSNTTNPTIRTAQANAVSSALCIIQGADVDTLTGPTNRQDGTHLTQVGNSAAATLDVNVINVWHGAPHC